MPISANEAVEVARIHRLTLADAASLRLLADTREHADRIAALFTSTDIATNGQPA